MAEPLYQIALDTENPDGTVTTIRGMPCPRREAERDAAHLGGKWYVRQAGTPDPIQERAEAAGGVLPEAD